MSEALGIVLPQPPCIRRELGRKLTLKYRNGIPPLARGRYAVFLLWHQKALPPFSSIPVKLPKIFD